METARGFALCAHKANCRSVTFPFDTGRNKRTGREPHAPFCQLQGAPARRPNPRRSGAIQSIKERRSWWGRCRTLGKGRLRRSKVTHRLRPATRPVTQNPVAMTGANVISDGPSPARRSRPQPCHTKLRECCYPLTGPRRVRQTSLRGRFDPPVSTRARSNRPLRTSAEHRYVARRGAAPGLYRPASGWMTMRATSRSIAGLRFARRHIGCSRER